MGVGFDTAAVCEIVRRDGTAIGHVIDMHDKQFLL